MSNVKNIKSRLPVGELKNTSIHIEENGSVCVWQKGRSTPSWNGTLKCQYENTLLVSDINGRTSVFKVDHSDIGNLRNEYVKITLQLSFRLDCCDMLIGSAEKSTIQYAIEQ